MLNFHRGKNRIFTKLVAIIMVQLFLVTNIAYAVPSKRSLFKNKRPDYKTIQGQRERALENKRNALSGKKEIKESPYKRDSTHGIKLSSLKDLSSIYIPDSLGRVIEVYQTSSVQGHRDRLVVHIQDLHTNPEAQLNSAGILELLIKDYGLGLVCSEGAEGIVDTSSVSSFPDYEVREKTARLFIDSGELTGEEYLSITRYPDLAIWGIEDRDIYFQNIIEFNKIMGFSQGARVFISQVKGALEALKPEIYSKRLLEIDSREREYERGRIDTNAYLDYLLGFTEGIAEIDKFKNIALLKETLELEKGIDNQKIQQQSQRLFLSLQGILERKQNRSETKTLLAKAALFKDRKISPFSFYSYLDSLARRHLKEDLDRYPDLLGFVEYLEKLNSIDSVRLFQEIEGLGYETKDLLSTDRDQKRLTRSLRHIKFLENFFNLKISNEELDYYLADKDGFKTDWFKSIITRLKKDTGKNHYIDYNPGLIDRRLAELEHFYDIARRRDIAMIDNTLSEIEKRDEKVTALIAGGFHTRGLTQLLKEKGYSYVVIAPYSSTDIDEENYQFLLSGKRSPLSELIQGLNNQLRTMLLWTSPELVDAYNRDCVPILADILGGDKKDLELSYGTGRMIPVLISQVLTIHNMLRPRQIRTLFRGWPPLEKLAIPGLGLRVLMQDDALIFRYKEGEDYKYVKADVRGDLQFVSEDEFKGEEIVDIRQSELVKVSPEWKDDPDYLRQRYLYNRTMEPVRLLELALLELNKFTDIDLQSEVHTGEVLSVGFGDNASEILALLEKFPEAEIIHAVDWIGDNIHNAEAELSIQPLKMRSKIKLSHQDASDLSFPDNSIRLIFTSNVLATEIFQDDPDKLDLIIAELSRVVAEGGYIITFQGGGSFDTMIQKFRNLGFEIVSDTIYQNMGGPSKYLGLIVRKPVITARQPILDEDIKEKGSPLHLLRYLVANSHYRGKPISIADIRKVRINPETGRSYVDSTIYLEINSLMEIGILESAGRGRYALSEEFTLDHITFIHDATKEIIKRDDPEGAPLGLDRYRLDDLEEEKIDAIRKVVMGVIHNIEGLKKAVTRGELFYLGDNIINLDQLIPLVEALEVSLDYIDDSSLEPEEKDKKSLFKRGLIIDAGGYGLDHPEERHLDIVIRDELGGEVAYVKIWPLRKRDGLSFDKKGVFVEFFGIELEWMKGKKICGPILYQALGNLLYDLGYRGIYGHLKQGSENFWETKKGGWEPTKDRIYIPGDTPSFYIEKPDSVKGHCPVIVALHKGMIERLTSPPIEDSRVIDTVNVIIDGIKPEASIKALNNSVERLAKTLGLWPGIARPAIERLLDQYAPEVDSTWVIYLNSALSKIVKISPQTIRIVIDAIIERRASSEVNPRVSSYLKNALYLDGISTRPEVSSYIEQLERAYKILNGLKGLIEDEDIRQNMRPLLRTYASIVMGLMPIEDSPRILTLQALLKQGLVEDDELEAMMLHEVIHAERGDEKIWPGIVRMVGKGQAKEAEEKVAEIEFEVDRKTVERLMKHNRDPMAYVRLLKKSDDVADQLEKQGYLKPSDDPRAILTPPIKERIKRLEDFLAERRKLRFAVELEKDFRDLTVYKNRQVEVSEETEQEIRGLILELWGNERAEDIYQMIFTLMQQAYKRKSPTQMKRDKDFDPANMWSEGDFYLESLPDTIVSRDKDVSPLQALHSFLIRHFNRDVFKGLNLYITPPFESPNGDARFDVSNYYGISSEVGTWNDFSDLSRDFKTMMDLVLNHTSTRSIWFQKFLEGDPEFRDFFISFYEDDLAQMAEKKLYEKNTYRPRTTPLFHRFQKKDGRYVYALTTFSDKEVDLNYKNPRVFAKILEVYLYYTLRGARAIRLDAMPYAWKEAGTSSIHHENTVKLLRLFRLVSDTVSPSTTLTAESMEPPEDSKKYLSDKDKKAHTAYNFIFSSLIPFSIISEDASRLLDALDYFNRFKGDVAWVNVLNGHDGFSINPVRVPTTTQGKSRMGENEISRLAEHGERIGLNEISEEFREEFYRRHGREPSFVNYKKADGVNIPYELGLTLASLFQGNADRIVAGLAISLSIKGIPSVYLLSLLAAFNDYELYMKTGNPRELNRGKIYLEDIEKALKDPNSLTYKVFNRTLPLLKARVTNKAFHPDASQRVIDSRNERIVSVLRTSPDKKQEILTLVNTSHEAQDVRIRLKDQGVDLDTFYDVISGEHYDIHEGVLSLRLEPYGVTWLGTHYTGPSIPPSDISNLHASWAHVKEFSPENYHETDMVMPDGKKVDMSLIDSIRRDKKARRAGVGEVIEINGYNFKVIEIQDQRILVSKDIIDAISDGETRALLSNALSQTRFEKIKDGLPLVITSLSKSPRLFEDCKKNSFIGINQAFLRLYSVYKELSVTYKGTPFEKECSEILTYLRIFLRTGLEHELRHEMGEESEDRLVDLDVARIKVLCIAAKIDLAHFVSFFKGTGVIDRDFAKQIVPELEDRGLDLMVRVGKDVLKLRSEWKSNPDSFTHLLFAPVATVNEDSARWIIRYMEENPDCFVGTGDMSRIGVMNNTFVRNIVSRLIPIMVAGADMVIEKYKGSVLRTGGDELGLVLPSDTTPEEVDRIRLELQATLASFISGMYGLVKIKGVTDENINDVDDILRTDALAGVYKDKDGFFMVFDRTVSSTGDLEKDCISAIDRTNLIFRDKKLDIRLERDGALNEIKSPRVSFGIVRASKGSDNVHANYGMSIRHAEYVLNIAKENDLHGATSEALGELDKFHEERKDAATYKLSDTERREIAEDYTRHGIDVYYDQIEEYYPVVKREYLQDVIQNASSAAIGTSVLVRGPPDNFYVITRVDSNFTRLIKLEFVYEPRGELKKKVEEAIRKGRFTTEDLRIRWDNGYGFKVVNEFHDHLVANQVILKEAEILNDIFSTRRDFLTLADNISGSISSEIGVETGVKVVLSSTAVDIKDIPDNLIEDIDDLAKINQGIRIGISSEGNKTKVLYEADRKKFEAAGKRQRAQERIKFTRILSDAYREPPLNERDFALLEIDTWRSVSLEGVRPLQGVKEDVFVIGDIHAALGAFRTILEKAGLIKRGISEDGLDDEWIAKKGTMLIQGGDAIDRGDRPKEAVRYLRYLQRTAEEKGSKLVRIIGNHELLYLLRHAEGKWQGRIKGLKDVGNIRGLDERLWADDEELVRLIREDIKTGHLLGVFELGGTVFAHGVIMPELIIELGKETVAQGLELERLMDPGVFTKVVNDILIEAIRTNNFDSIVFSFGFRIISHVDGITSYYFGKLDDDYVDMLPFSQVVFHDPSPFKKDQRIAVKRGKATGTSIVDVDVGMAPTLGGGRAAVLYRDGKAMAMYPAYQAPRQDRVTLASIPSPNGDLVEIKVGEPISLRKPDSKGETLSKTVPRVRPETSPVSATLSLASTALFDGEQVLEDPGGFRYRYNQLKEIDDHTVAMIITRPGLDVEKIETIMKGLGLKIRVDFYMLPLEGDALKEYEDCLNSGDIFNLYGDFKVIIGIDIPVNNKALIGTLREV